MALTKKKGMKILVKCSWSGARIPTPEVFTSSSTLSQVISSIAPKLPPIITKPLVDGNEAQPAIVYMRTHILKRDWEITRLGDFCEGGSILLTLNLPKEDGRAAVPKVASLESVEPMDIDEEPSAVAAAVAPAAVPMPASTISSSNQSSSQELAGPSIRSPKQAMQRLVNSNFDKDSQECLSTILKMVGNIIAKNDAKFRSIRITNKTVEKKIVSKKGGLDILFALGFEYDAVPRATGFDFDNSNARQAEAQDAKQSETIVLRPENEDQNLLESARRDLNRILTMDLKVSPNDIPAMPRLRQQVTNINSRTAPSATAFDPFKSHSFNTQAAAVGAPNPNSINPDGTQGKSSTERKLDALIQKQQKLEQSIQTLDDRCITAFLPGETGPIVSLRSPGGLDIGEGKSDSALIASQMMKKMEERKKKEEGGFTTKSMRDLEKMKNAKVYSHAKLKICFPDGSYLEAKFLPSEKIANVKAVVQSTFVPEVSATYQFDLYISPPRRMLTNEKSLKEEGLVPAAKIHVSWITGASPLPNTPAGSYLQRKFYQNTAISSGRGAFPSSVKVVEPMTKNTDSSKNGGHAGDTVSKEEELMQRMLGKRKGLLGKGSSKKLGNSKSDSKKGSGKPKWFKG